MTPSRMVAKKSALNAPHPPGEDESPTDVWRPAPASDSLRSLRSLRPIEPTLSLSETHPTGTLDAGSRDLFRRRLRLCCLILAAPVGFYLFCASTNLIELVGRTTLGLSGLILSCLMLFGLTATAFLLSREVNRSESSLRALEIGIFGGLAVFFAYLHFLVMTQYEQATTLDPENPVGAVALFGKYEESARTTLTMRSSRAALLSNLGLHEELSSVARYSSTRSSINMLGKRYEQTTVLAAALLVHFNWFAILVLHGVLVPNTLMRGVGVAVGICLLALLISVVAAAFHAPTGRHGEAVISVSITMLAAGTGLSIFGTAKTQALQREVQSAREAVRELGQYRLRRKLGVGGMGEVYLAEHRLLKRPCALKRIHPRFLNNIEQLRRFEREVQATARLRHPNTVEIYDYGRAEDGTFYYVMEYLPGLSLEDMVNRYGPQPADRAIHLLRQVCGALREAHRNGLVHRDIKPSNIIVFQAGLPHDHVKLVDFGLVHTLTDEEGHGSKITREGLIVGTPEYMSPEQASGGVLDGRSDLFSLGSVAYFLLTGREAFHKENSMKTLISVVSDHPTPIESHGIEIPADMAAVIQKCMAKAPADRFFDAASLDEALAACSSADDWTEPRAFSWWAERPEATPRMIDEVPPG